MIDRPFAPAWGNQQWANNSATATAAYDLPESCDQVVLTNTSLTARVHFLVTRYTSQGSPPTGDAPTTTTGLGVLPQSQIRITVPPGPKVIRTIATAADGLYGINPGNGN